MKSRFCVVGLCIAFIFVTILAGQIWAEETEKININKAPLEELVKLKRVGPSFAQRIIEYRQETPFKSPEDIMNVPGIGLKTYEDNKDIIVVD